MWSALSECSPWMPRIYTWYLSAISLNIVLSSPSLGNLMWTDALRAVPRFVGHEVMYPKWSSYANYATFSICSHAFYNLSNTSLILESFCIEIILS